MITLMQHQKRFVEIAQQRPAYCWFAEPGCGKTIGVLAAIHDAKQRGYTGKTCVLAPKSILRSAWEGDARHFPSLKVVVCWHASAAQRRKLIATAGVDILVMNYETFKKHIPDLIAAGVTRLVVDESSKLKNPESQISKACYEFSRQCNGIYLLSGTPAPNSQTEYFGQIRCVDPFQFGTNFWRFAYRYFTPRKRVIGDKERIIGWTPIPSMQEEFQERLASCSWSLRKIDCLDLPDQVDVVREVELSDAEWRAYAQVLEELRVEFGDGEKLSVSANAALMKLRQITGGVLHTPHGPRRLGTGKLDETRALLEELGNQQVVLWAIFRPEIDSLVEMLSDMGCSVSRMDGSVDAETRATAISAFQAGKTQYLVCQPQAAGHGVTLTAACYAIYYSNSFSWETYQQSRDRIHRCGQQRKCTYYHLIVPGTVDERVMHALRHKKSGHDIIMEILHDRGEGMSEVRREAAEVF